jgi:malate synthase
MSVSTSESVQINGSSVEGAERVLTPEAIEFAVRLHREFNGRRRELLQRRQQRQQEFREGAMPDFLSETESVRTGDWRVASCPADLQDRRVEITGPVDRKMMINALNSGAKAFMADIEDSMSPTWENVVAGQVNLMDAVRRTLEFRNPDGKEYRLNDEIATLLVRPRGWHLPEKNVQVDGEPISASLFDFGLYFFHNAKETLDRGTGPYFYLPKLESHLEARLWNDVFNFAQDERGVPRGTIRATVLIETILAAFEMEEILYELREHMAGLNAGRWDYIFSMIKRFRHRDDMILPDRAQVTMGVPFMRAYAELLVRSCHKRGAHAIGGMAAFIPNRRDPTVTENALKKVTEDKEREANAGFDGTWVAHPDLVSVAGEIFDRVLAEKPNQKDRLREDVSVRGEDLLNTKIEGAAITEQGVRTNIDVGVQYIAAWLGGTGAAAIYNLMEDAATAEISRAQLWQWIRHGAEMNDGEPVTQDLYRRIRDEEVGRLVEQDPGNADGYRNAAKLMDELVLTDEFVEFLTLPAYRELA